MRRRRNGKEASCEPCRQGKVRCDHGRAVCGRCRRRGLQSECYYHPAPLTKASATVVPLVEDVEPSTEIVIETSGNNSLQPSHLSQPPDGDYERRLELVEGVLQELRYLPFLRSLIYKYYSVSKSTNVPAPLVLPAIDSLFSLVENDAKVSRLSMRPLAESVIRSTSKPLGITKSTSYQEFLAMHTGHNLRLEYLGVLYSIAGRASKVVLSKQEHVDTNLVHRLFRQAETCLQLATEISPAVTDAIVWLSLENTVLSTVARGDDNEIVERYLATLSSHIFAMGFHRESTCILNTPFFLSECRKWTFFKAYNMEILVSQLKSRPPRILMRYSDAKPPLDLADDDIVAEASQRELACSRLSIDGWNTSGQYSTASFRRARLISLQTREEALEYDYRPMTVERAAELRNLSSRCQRAWDSLPAHMKYTPACWDSDLQPVSCMIVLVIRLGFLQSDCEIFRALERIDPQATASLITVAHESLALISHLSDYRGRSIYIHFEFSSVLLGYGLPCALVLSTALKNLSQQTGPSYILPENISRSTMIRDLAVFVAQLDTTAVSAESNAEACARASSVISRTLDDLLNAPTTITTSDAFPTAKDGNVADDPFQRLDFDAMLDDADLANWIKSLEGTNNMIDWYNF